VAQLGILLAISFAMRGVPLLEWVRVAAVIVALVPQGLFFMTTIAYAMGAMRVANSGALIQESNAVESVSNVNLLCLDKTGTLTTNNIIFHTLRLLEEGEARGEDAITALLGDYAATNAGGTRTSAAIQAAFGGRARPVQDQASFDSERKWSALMLSDVQPAEVYVLGAPEVLQPHLAPGTSLGPQVETWAAEGLRVLLFASGAAATGMRDPESELRMPQALKPLALLSFRDELRPEAEDTLQRFSELGIDIKIISGDNPQTVAALAKQAGMRGDLQIVSGLDLREMDPGQAEKAAEEATIFGRITPQQKEELVRTFRQKGRYVAMIGDGVNDVLSLKQAHVGIAMQSGSAAARSVADVILLGDSFAALPVAFREGQRIVKGMEDVVRLLLTRTLYVLLLVIATRIVEVPFPVTPKHNSILALLTVGIPILAIAAWARPGAPPRSVMRSTSHFILPAAFTIAIVALAVYLAYLGMTGDAQVARTALTTATVFCGLLLIPFVEPPTRFWEGGDDLSGDWRPAILALGMLLAYGVVLAVPGLRGFFELSPLRIVDYLIIAAGVAIWALLLRLIWRTKLFERVLSRS
jgi:cation-transporting ATPase E